MVKKKRASSKRKKMASRVRATQKPKAQSSRADPSLSFVRFMGISLGGGKSDRTVLTVLDYYVSHKKLVVSRIIDRLKSEGEVSADFKLIETIYEHKNHLHLIALDVPLSVPKCLRCELVCPGYETCNQEEILWLWKHHRNQVKKNKNHRLFTPYTRRCVEELWASELGGSWSLGDAMGANQAPLLARGHFITRRMKPSWKSKVIEVIPRLSLLRWSSKQKLLKYIVNESRHSVQGFAARDYVLKKLSEELDLFLYEQDRTTLMESLVAFDSLWASLSAFWAYQKKTEVRPKSFPKQETWIEVPHF